MTYTRELDVLDQDFDRSLDLAEGEAHEEPVNKESTNVDTKPNRKKIALAGLVGAGAVAGVAASIFFVGGTGADWSDEESTGGSFSTGDFEIEISTDGGESWQDGTDLENNAGLTLADLPEDFAFEAGDTAQTVFYVRAAEPTTHDGVIDAAEVEHLFSIDDEIDGEFSWTIIERDSEDFRLSGVISEDEDAAVEEREGTVVLPADQTPVVFGLAVEAHDTLPESEEAYELSAAWNLTAFVDENSTHEDNNIDFSADAGEDDDA
ncbi:hypothetical protein [Nesterenkonia alba]|uniref:hypothetical protein n=1 Tax=Nesterenkonia alba TaxID=515814 RepID=UPI0003B2FA70|nr:hypothetical protein [Nesterenkonia alba]